MKRLLALLVIGTLAWLPNTASADSIDPAEYETTLAVGESVTIDKTVTITMAGGTALVDVFFLADETGSMFDEIASVKASAAAILASTAGLGDVAFGVGGYRDVGDAWIYREIQDLTSDQPTAQAGINTWAAGGGGDFPEANLPALEGVANDTSWRTGSERLVVWFGDAPGHDPRDGSTEATATASLIGAGVQVIAVDVGSLNSTGQAVRISAATGGQYLAGISDDTIVAAITSALETAISEYTTVCLDASEAPGGVGVGLSACHVGEFDRSEDREFDFEVEFTGVAPGDYEFPIYATVDGGRVAREIDTIHVTGDTKVPEPSTLSMVGLALVGLAWARKRLS